MEIEPKNPELNFYPVTSTPPQPFVNSNTPNRVVPDSNIVPSANGSKVINDSIQSGNFVRGSAGWELDSNGNLDASNGNFRGVITGASGAIGGWNIGSTTLSSTGVVLDAGNQKITVGSAAPNMVIDGANKRIRTSTYSAGLQGLNLDGATGNAEFNNISARGEFRTQVLSYGSVHSEAGSRIMSKSAGTLKSDFTSVTSPTTFNVDVNDPPTGHTQLFAASDILRVKDGSGGDNWLTVSSVSDQTTFFRYVCTLSNGSTATFRAGAAIIDYGQSGQAFIYETVDDANAPFYSIRTHAGSPWSTTTERVRLGNLNGMGSFASTTYGISINDNTQAKYLTYDTATGNLVINGYVQNGKGAFGGDGSDGALSISSGTTTIDLGNADVVTKNYTSIVISGTGKLAFSNPATTGTIIILKSQGVVTLTSSTSPCIDASGMGGAGGTGGAGNVVVGGQAGTAGTSGFGWTVTNPGALGNPRGGAAGAGGTATAFTLDYYLGTKSVRIACGAGGGGAGSGGGTVGSNGVYGNTGGDGGNGGGGLIIESGGALNFTGTISVAGAAGANGQTGNSANYSGGGGGSGGAGGTCYLIYNTLTANSGTITVSGGAAGTGGAGNADTGGSSGGSGANQTAGTIGNVAGGSAGANGSAGGNGSSLVILNNYFA